MNIPEQIKTLNCDFTQSNLFSKNLQEFKDIFDNDIFKKWGEFISKDNYMQNIEDSFSI